jgi:hypothetical protein
MALRRSLQLLERADVAPALKKLWKKHVPVNGMVTQHLSPFEQHIVSPLFKDFNKKVMFLCSCVIVLLCCVVVCLLLRLLGVWKGRESERRDGD